MYSLECPLNLSRITLETSIQSVMPCSSRESDGTCQRRREREANRAVGNGSGILIEDGMKIGRRISPPACARCDVPRLVLFDLLFHPIASTFDGDGLRVMQQAVQNG